MSRSTSSTNAYRRIRHDIVTCKLGPAERLRMRELCAAYETSVNPLREALFRLVSERFVRFAENRGFTVAEADATSFAELTRARIWLNKVAVRRSIELARTDVEEALLIAYHRLSRLGRQATSPGTSGAADWGVAHRVFHHALLAGCDSVWVRDYCEILFDHAERYRNLLPAPPVRKRKSLDDHGLIMEAVLEHRTAEASRMIGAHIQRTSNAVLAYLQSTVHGTPMNRL